MARRATLLVYPIPVTKDLRHRYYINAPLWLQSIAYPNEKENMNHPKNSGHSGFFPALLIGMAVLFLWQAAAAESGSDQGTNADSVGAWKTLIGNRYQTERPVEFRLSPSSRETRGAAPGQTFTVKDLILDPADAHNAAYAVRLDSGESGYIGVRDLQGLIQSGAVVNVDSVSEGGSKRGIVARESTAGRPLSATVKEEPQATTPGARDLRNDYHSVTHRASRQVEDLLSGNLRGEDLPMLMAIAGALSGLVWALWHMMGCAKTLSFLGIIPLLHYSFVESPGKPSLVPFLALLLALVVLLGFWSFARLAIIVAASTVIDHVAFTVYHQTGNVTLVALVSLATAVIVGVLSFVLLKKTYGIEQLLNQE